MVLLNSSFRPHCPVYIYNGSPFFEIAIHGFWRARKILADRVPGVLAY